MSTSSNLKNVDELDNALRLLDHELSGLGLDQPLRIRAIGGYALMRHGVRSEDRAFTVDIDTVTKDYDAAVKRAIETVAEKAGLDSDWLNNYNVMDNDPDQVEEMFDAKWEPQSMDLRNIALDIASVETLTRSKIMAADDYEHNGRDRDVPDLCELLAHQGITSPAQFASKYPDPFGEHPTVGRLVQEHFGGAPARGKQAAAERFPELADDTSLDDDLGDYDESWEH